MRDLLEMRKADENELLSLAKLRIKSFPILKEIYDEEFLTDLVRYKNNYDNLLLFWLVVDSPIDVGLAYGFLKDIEEDLELFHSQRDFKVFRAKFRQWNTVAFEAAVTELEFAAEYLRRGYQIELDPDLPNNRKMDFYANKRATKIYFELKTIYTEASNEDQTIMNELSDRFSRMDQHVRISVDIKEEFKPSQTVEVSRYIRQKIKEIEENSIDLPFSFSYPENNDPIVIVDVLSRVPDSEKGYIAGFVFGGGIKGDWSDLRRKIVSGVSQLHPSYPGVIIVKPHGLQINQYDIENALFGDLKVNLLGKPQCFRGGDRIFAEKKNNRLSAVVYCEERLHELGYVKKKFVYHNPFAAIRLSADVFKGENVVQFSPK
jgi:hypothetical protein